MNKLPTEFTTLREISKGEEFMRELRWIVTHRNMAASSGVTVFEITEHIVYGVVQLAHHHRDRLQGSKRKSFIRIIPRLLDIKDTMLKRKTSDLAGFLERKLAEH